MPQKTFSKLPSIDNNNIDKLQFQLSTLSFNDAIFDVTDYSLYISISGLVIIIIIVFGIIGYVYYRNRASKIKREGKFVSIMLCNSYIHKLEEKPVRVLRRNIIHPPLIKRVYAECNLLFQLIKLINILKVDPNDQILKKRKVENSFLHWFWF